jgi:DNA-binding NarL/FixJ family response regulator
VRVVIGDAAALPREGLAALLARHGHQVPACVGSVDGIGRAIAVEQPDLVITDAGLPTTDPVAPPRPRAPAEDDGPPLVRLRARHPDLALLVLSAQPSVDLVRSLLRIGVAGLGFLVRDRIPDVTALLDAAGLVAAGGSAVDPEVVARLLTPAGGPLAPLSARERDVLALLAEGRTNAAIAGRLWLTPRTVEGHVRSIFGKLRLPATPDDHRRVLAARVYLGAETQGSAK